MCVSRVTQVYLKREEVAKKRRGCNVRISGVCGFEVQVRDERGCREEMGMQRGVRCGWDVVPRGHVYVCVCVF